MADDVGTARAPSAVPPGSRIDAIDAVRGAARFGVVVVNVLTAFRISIFEQFLPGPPVSPGFDGAIEKLVAFAFEEKFFSLFSLLFGVGLAIQFERFARGGRPYYLLTRRLLALLAFGLVHLLLIWNGDVLTHYALAGLIVLPLLRLRRSSLAAMAVGLLVLYALLSLFPPLVALPSPEALADHVARASIVYAHGSFAEIVRFSIGEIGLLLPLHVSVFPRTVGLFVLGAWIWRSGVLQHARDNTEAFGAAAVIGILAGVALTSSATPFLRSLARVALAIGYGSVIVRIALIDEGRRLLAPFAAIGRMAFSNYILQSVIFSLVFMGYGLGLFGQMGAGSALLLVVLVYSVQAIASTAWLSRFRFGPLEWLWRSITYNRAQPMRLRRAVSATNNDSEEVSHL
jgi:uncharacterized protein